MASVLSTEDREALNALFIGLRDFSRQDDNKLGAAMVGVVMKHLQHSENAAAALYLATMLRDINHLNNWYSREVNIDLGELRQRILDANG